MGITTSNQIYKYYERFRAIDVTFTKEVIKATGLVTQQVFLKCLGETWPCVIYSSSFEGAKIIVNARSGLHEKIQRANNLVSLRYSFKEPEKIDPFMFFVAGRVAGFAPYGGSPDVALLSMAFTQRPPDDLIEVMGRLMEANVNSTKRREERILLTPDATRRLGLAAKETAVFIQGVPRRCILRDLSFSGAKVIMVGVAKFVADKEVSIRLDFEDPRESFLIKGRSVRQEDVEGRKDLIAVAINYIEQTVPMNYKLRINDYLTQGRAENRGESRIENDEANGDK